MTVFLGSENKLQKLVTQLLKCKQGKNYHLTIVSCYFTLQSAQLLINEVRGKIDYKKLNIEIYIDKFLSTTQKELCNWQRNLKNEGIDISIYAFKGNSTTNSPLFHPKAYCLISCNEDNKNCWGSLVVGSANLTGKGLTKDTGNIELLLDIQKFEFINNFYSNLKKLKNIAFINIENLNYSDFYFNSLDEKTGRFAELEEIEEDETYYFHYRLLCLGYLVNRWDANQNFASYFKIKYTLKLQQTQNQQKEDSKFKDILNQTQFNLIEKQKSITKDYSPDLVKNFLKKQKESGKFFRLKGNYGVETLLGCWIPKQIVEKLRIQEDFNVFKKEFIASINEQYLSRLKEEIDNDWKLWKEWIKTENPSQKTIESIKVLIQDEASLKRIYERYSICNFPYHISQKQEVENLYKSLIESCKTQSNNETKETILDVDQNPHKGLSPIESLNP